jgi:hypothetical protein
MRLFNQRRAFVFWNGGIAQLGERVLCKHEVVGSIPSASTRGQTDRRIMRALNNRPRNITLHAAQVFTKTAACEISDIVKRRSIRAWVAKHIARYVLRNLHYLQVIFGARSSQDE